MEEAQALISAAGNEFFKGDQQPDIVVDLKPSRSEKNLDSETCCSGVEPKRLALHSAVLRAGSPFFAALLRWDPEGADIQKSSPSELVVEGCLSVNASVNASVLALQLIYCDALRRPAVGRVRLDGVDHALAVLKACSYFLSDFGIEHCRLFLEVAPWTPQDPEKISFCFRELGLELGANLTDRLNVSSNKRGEANAILQGMFAAALSSEGPTFEQKYDDYGSCILITSERPRLVLEELAKSSWTGFDLKIVQKVADRNILQRPWFTGALACLDRLRLSTGNYTVLKYLVEPETSLKQFIRTLSCLSWLSILCCKHVPGIGSCKTLWTSDDAESFASRASESIFRLYSRNRRVRPLLDMFAKLVFQPLEMLYLCAAKDSPVFDDQSRAALLRLWLPMLLKFEQADLLRGAFQPACLKSLFASLSEEGRASLTETWSTKELNLSHGDSAEGTLGGFLSEQLKSQDVSRQSIDSIEIISRLLKAFTTAKDHGTKEHTAKDLVQEAAQLIKREPHRVGELAQLWSELPLESSPANPLLLDASVLILAAVADVNNLVHKSVRYLFLTAVLPILLQGDKVMKLHMDTTNSFETVFSALSFCEQKQLALQWVERLGQKESEGAKCRRISMDKVFEKWCRTLEA